MTRRAGRGAARKETWPDPGDPRFPTRPVWINGTVRSAADAHVSVFDRGARDGLALVETVRVERRVPELWHPHMERLVLSAAELGFPVPPSADRLAEAVQELLGAAGLDDAAVRITVTRGVHGLRPGRPGCWIDAEPLSARLWPGTRSGNASAVVWDAAFAPGPLGCYKTANRLVYQHAADQARIAGTDEALLADADGRLLEGANSNVFVVHGDSIATPPLSAGILPGVTRAAVIEALRVDGIAVAERTVTLAELDDATEVFVTNAIQRLCNLRRIDGRELPRGRIFACVRDAFLRLLTQPAG